MKIKDILNTCIIFLLGFLSFSLLSYYSVYGLENPFPAQISSLNLPFGFLNFSMSNYSKQAPHDFVQENQIEVYPDKIIININNASISKYAPTGSMKPVLDEYSNGIRIIPQSESEIHLGDIITFEENENLIVHRVVEIGEDFEGKYFITKGDNNSVADGKIRFKDIKYITIGIIW